MAELETESQGIEIQVHNSAQGIEVQVQDPVVTCINGMFEELSPVSPDRCIYRVHQALRKLKPEAYTPQVVSIGPLHRGNSSLQAMEEHKLRYLHDFLTRFNLSLNDCVIEAREMEKRARDCYADTTSDITSDEFVNMLLVDGAFVIMLLLNHIGQQNADDYIFNRPRLLDQVINDIILLENQLPFFVVEHMYNKLVSCEGPTHPLLVSFHSMLEDMYNKLVSCEGPTHPLLVSFHSMLDDNKYLSGDFPNISITEVKHFTDFVRTCLISASPRIGQYGDYSSIPNAEKLYDAGVKFKKSSSKGIVDIQYKDGELQIPRFEVNDTAESFYRNVIAFEMYHCKNDTYVIDTYVIDCLNLMDDLINTTRDVDLLVQKGIIYNGLGDNHAVATLFNNLLKEITPPGVNYFGDIYEGLNAYCNAPMNIWKVVLKGELLNYFGTPFRTVSTIAAVILLVLTFLDTLWTIKSSKWESHGPLAVE